MWYNKENELRQVLKMILFPLFINQPKATPPTPQELHEKVATIKYSARWWHSQLENYPLQKVVARLGLAEKQGLVRKENNGNGDCKVFTPCKSLGKNKKEREEKIFDFLLKNA
jgi:hypothetical protein